MIDPTERIHEKNPDPKIILKSIDLLGRYQEKRPTRYKKNLNPRIRIKIVGSVPSENDKRSYRYRFHKSRIRRLDPRDLNAGPDLQLYERVPIQNEVPDSKKKIKVPIEKIKVPIQNEVPNSRKIKVPIQN
jgi:hypothetical protein